MLKPENPNFFELSGQRGIPNLTSVDKLLSGNGFESGKKFTVRICTVHQLR